MRALGTTRLDTWEQVSFEHENQRLTSVVKGKHRDREALRATPETAAARRRQLRINIDEWARAGVAAELAAGGEPHVAERYLTCHTTLLELRCRSELHHRRFTAIGCDRRICELCAPHLAAREAGELLRRLKALAKQGVFRRGSGTNRPGFKFLTLTLAPREDLGNAFLEVQQGWRKLQQRLGFVKDRRAGLFGAVAAVEIGRHRNVHLHVLYWGRYVPKQRISDTWRAITGDSYIVHIQAARGKRADLVREVVKYVTKLSRQDNPNQSPDQEPTAPEARLIEIHQVFNHRRRLTTYGVFYNVQDKEARPESRCDVCSTPEKPVAWAVVGEMFPEYLPPLVLWDYLYPGQPPPARVRLVA